MVPESRACLVALILCIPEIFDSLRQAGGIIRNPPRCFNVTGIENRSL
ncbi:hypothetical protein KSP9073_00313 [Kushneria phyllosphaerae]|uniref:Uncharacterized protein n=1 Tax=Kushneria phyllosphaerae TaxID=2100822 RepID=A0A2R8CHG8_9GAMM|nr:hypothetical protein KSP9073_00313 [Kushneria phyllosphaerae]